MKKPIQGSFFEEGYLLQSLGAIARDPEYALTELVANAWDAGATKVEITIPDSYGQDLIVSDNGHGMTPDQFKQRWMTLGYSRLKHQDKWAEFPPGVNHSKRLAYGRNGIGRHSMFCFADEYLVVTKRDGTESLFELTTDSGDHPFIIRSEKTSKANGYGTLIRATITRNLPEPDSMRETIAARFIHDPEFQVGVNGITLKWSSLQGVEDPVKLEIEGLDGVEVIVVDTQKSARTKQKQGFGFHIHNRLIGEPSWTLGSSTPIDARTTFGRRFAMIVKCDAMEEEIEPDWSRLRKGPKRTKLFDALSKFALQKFQEFSQEKVEETKRTAFNNNLSKIRDLNGTARIEVAHFVDAVVEKEPTINAETLSTAVDAVINLQQTKSGQSLLQKLASFTSEDIEALDKLLSEWSAQDALIVLDEIDRRIATISAIEILSAKEDIDELHTLHPLVTEARWLFGPEFESCEYASNQSLKNATNKVFKVNSSNSDYDNWRKRPDLLMLADSTVSAVALEEMDSHSGLIQTRKVLLLELKKGHSKIGKKEINQADAYIDEIRSCGHIQGNFFINCFVIGHSVDTSVTLRRTLKNNDNDIPHSEIYATCFTTLTQSAKARLFKIKDKLQDRYEEISGTTKSSILNELLNQQELELIGSPN